MAYIIPPTWVAGHIVTAAEFNQYINANITAVKAIAEQAGADILPLKTQLVYIQLFGATDLVTSVANRAYFFVPSYLSGKTVKRMGMGQVVASSSPTRVTFALSGNPYVENVSTTESGSMSIALPTTGNKVGISVTAGGGSPKGLDFWFEVGL